MNVHVPNRGRPIRPRRARGSARWLDRFARYFHRMLDRIDAGLAEGGIEATLPDGTHRILGRRAAGPVAIVELRSWRALVRLGMGGSAGWYRAWADGDWSSPDPVPLFDLFMRNAATLGQAARASGPLKFVLRVGHWLRRNTPGRARRNIEYHYDLGNDFYALWLDPGMTYSSAMFPREGMTLEQAQATKHAAVLDRLELAAGGTILEIGCGWGSFMAFAAAKGYDVTGITLSPEQKAHADGRLAGADAALVELVDYRHVTGQYDALVSVEMVEAVGRQYWGEYLGAIARVLRPGGRAAIQYILIADELFDAYADGVDFIQRYVFPGGMLISESRFRALAEAQGLSWHDRVGFGADYAETLRRWRDAFDAAVDAGRLPVEFDRHFVDLWRYYLMYCEGGFRGGGIDVAQVTLVKEA